MKNQEDVFLDNTVMSESERNSVLVEDKEELEEIADDVAGHSC